MYPHNYDTIQSHNSRSSISSFHARWLVSTPRSRSTHLLRRSHPPVVQHSCCAPASKFGQQARLCAKLGRRSHLFGRPAMSLIGILPHRFWQDRRCGFRPVCCGSAGWVPCSAALQCHSSFWQGFALTGSAGSGKIGCLGFALLVDGARRRWTHVLAVTPGFQQALQRLRQDQVSVFQDL